MKEVGKTWSLGGIKLAVEEDSMDYTAIRMGHLGPLDRNETVLHYGGTEAYARDLTAILFSGYEDNFLPLIGSGYHTLISDQGDEGSYFITGCKPRRLQALNKPAAAVYRLQLDLRKESLTTQRAFVATISDGLYYSSLIRLNDNDVPVWSRVGQTLNISYFDCDSRYPANTQVCIADNIAYIRRSTVGANWTSILTESDIDTIIHSDTWTMRSIAYNAWVPGEVYVLVDDATNDGIYFLYNTSYGSGAWTAVAVYTSIFHFAYQGSNISISDAPAGTYNRGDVMYLAGEWAAGHIAKHAISVNRGRSWTRSSLASGGTAQGWVYAHPTIQNTHYAGRGVDAGGGDDLAEYTPYSVTLYSILDGEAGPNDGPVHAEMWVNPNDVDMQATVRDNTGVSVYLISTDDGWSSSTKKELTIDSAFSRIHGSDDGFIIGRALTPDSIYAYETVIATPDDGTTLYYKSGSDPENNADGKSIPKSANGVTRNGIRIWRT